MGRKIDISPAFCAMLCLLGWLDLEITLLFLAAVVIHEIAHLVAAVLCGVIVERIHFRVCGAVIHASGMSYRQELVISAAGPAASLISAFLLCFISSGYFAISTILALVNLLPIYPMDGGRILRSILSLRCAEVVVQRTLRALAFITCGVLMVVACWHTAVYQGGIWPIFAVLAILLRVGEASGEN